LRADHPGDSAWLAARLHEEAQAVIAKRVDDLTALRARLAEAGADIARERATHADTQTALQQRVVDVERLAQQARVLGGALL
jgi:hypothetical protein